MLSKSILVLLLFFLPALVNAANWHSFGTCSYHTDPDGDEVFQLVSQSACRQDFYGGTGFWQSAFMWENGNKVNVVFNIDANGNEAWRVNGHPVLVPEVQFTRGDGQVNFGLCFITKAQPGFEATCYKRIGEQIQGH